MNTVISVSNSDTLEAVRSFLRSLLENGIVEAVLVPMRTPSGAVTPALVTSPQALGFADPLAPVMPINSAASAGKLSARPVKAKIGVVLRSCEARAVIELTKMQQASLENLVLIHIDCAGTFNVPDYTRLSKNGENLWVELFRTAAVSPESPHAELRQACKMCEKPVYDGRTEQDIFIHLLGTDYEQAVSVSLPSEIAEKLGLPQQETAPDYRAAVIAKLTAAREASRDAEFAAVRARLESKENHGAAGIQAVFSACIRCHNCMTVCPICYCKTCVFKSHIFDHEPQKYLEWSLSKGALRMPADSVLFHMTRLNHMSLSCVGCGMCTEACPAELPVGSVFRAIGQRVQQTFEYTPGASVDDPLPLVTFKADEWTEVGE